ncbi:hypothetical protein H4R26_000693, partial [Coemansia thaxteri]
MDGLGQGFSQLQKLAHKYDGTPCTRYLPWALHPTLQLVPVIGNVIVFAQTAQFIRRVNQAAPMSSHERFEIWVSAVILLILGMVPVVGFYLTLYCTICSDYLVIASRSIQLRGDRNRVDIEAPMEMRAQSVRSFVLSPIAKPASVHIAESVKRQGSIMSSRSASSTKRGSVIKVEAPAAVVQEISKLDRVSRMNWMDEVMALSPTENYRTSL